MNPYSTICAPFSRIAKLQQANPAATSRGNQGDGAGGFQPAAIAKKTNAKTMSKVLSMLPPESACRLDSGWGRMVALHPILTQENNLMASLSFRNSKVVYYGPHPCENCGETICRAGNEYGSSSFTYPSNPIYPNTEWNPHLCNPHDVRDQRGREAKREMLVLFPDAVPLKIRDLYVISKDGGRLIISPNHNYHDTIWAAWLGAKEREDKNWPTWELDHVPSSR